MTDEIREPATTAPAPGHPDGGPLRDDAHDRVEATARPTSSQPDPAPERGGILRFRKAGRRAATAAFPAHRRLRQAALAAGLIAAIGAAALAWWFVSDSRPPSLLKLARPDPAARHRPAETESVPSGSDAAPDPRPAQPAVAGPSLPHAAAEVPERPPVATARAADATPAPAAIVVSAPAPAAPAGAAPPAATTNAATDIHSPTAADASLDALQATQDRLFRLRLQRDETRLRSEICEIATPSDQPEWCGRAAPPSASPTRQPAPPRPSGPRPAAAIAAPPPLAAVAGRPGALVAVFLGEHGPLERRTGDTLGDWRVERIDSDGQVRLAGPGGTLIRRAGR